MTVSLHLTLRDDRTVDHLRLRHEEACAVLATRQQLQAVGTNEAKSSPVREPLLRPREVSLLLGNDQERVRHPHLVHRQVLQHGRHRCDSAAEVDLLLQHAVDVPGDGPRPPEHLLLVLRHHRELLDDVLHPARLAHGRHQTLNSPRERLQHLACCPPLVLRRDEGQPQGAPPRCSQDALQVDAKAGVGQGLPRFLPEPRNGRFRLLCRRGEVGRTFGRQEVQHHPK